MNSFRKVARMEAERVHSSANIERLICLVRGRKVILDSDLTRIYDVETRVLNRAVKRHRTRFPSDFMFKLTMKEAADLKRSRSQVVILKRGGNVKHLPYAFTEHGAIMAANVLRSKRAVRMSVFVVRAFIRMRAMLDDNQELARRLAALERELKGRIDLHEAALVEIIRRIMNMIDPPALPEGKKRPIGFGV